ncbi:MAG: DUF4357 domain-containing protein [Rhizobiaceae bacterium]|nr:DUF4357 domain-containing protein [Rhizobiaceae bacterium]
MDIFRYEVGKAAAEGFPVGGNRIVEFVVLAGSTALNRSKGADRKGKLPLRRDRLLNDGILAPHARDTDLYVFVRDHRFTSPTAAGDIVNGASLSGRAPWLHKVTGQSLKDWLVP